jgi:hypothetical protein
MIDSSISLLLVGASSCLLTVIPSPAVCNWPVSSIYLKIILDERTLKIV